MAVVTKTIGSGKDHATVAAWEAAVGNFGTDIYKGVISTDDNFNENVTLTGGTGTPSITSYLWLTVASANRHSGVAGTGHGRMYGTGNSHIITIDQNFTRVEWLDIKQDQAGNSDEGIRVGPTDKDVLISYCIIWTDQTATNDQDGINFLDASGADSDASIDNCIIYGWVRAGIHPNYSSLVGAGATLTLNIDHCSIHGCGETGENESGGVSVRSEDVDDTIVLNVFNTWAAATAVNAPFVDGEALSQPDTPVGTVTWNGSDNGRDDTTDHIQGTDNTTAWEDATDGVAVVTKSTGSWIVVTNVTGGSEDFTLLDDAAGNIMAGRGINRQGSEPDARQDFSVDITGGARPTTGVDIGAHQVSGAATIDLTHLSSTTFPAMTVADSSFQLAHLASTAFFSMQLDGEVVLALLSSTTIFSPTLTSTIDLAHLANTTFFSPQLDGNIDLTLLSSTTFPTIHVLSVLDMALLSGTTLFAFQLDGNIDLTLLSSTVFPTMQLDGEILLTHLANTTFPAFFVDGNIDLAHLANTTIFSPQLDGEILLTQLAGTNIFSITVVTPASDPLDMDLLSSTTFPTPLLVAVLDLALLSSTSLFAMQLDGNIDLSHLANTTFPSITVGEASVDLAHLSSTTLFSTFIDGNIDLTHLDNTVVFNLTVGDAAIDLDLLSSTVFFNIVVVDPSAVAVGIQLPMRGVDR